MNYQHTFGWYYINANQKSPSWTGVPYLYNFLTRQSISAGPKAHLCAIDELVPGDLVQLSFTGDQFQHSPVVVSVTAPYRPEDILIAAHTDDSDYRPLSTYAYLDIRFLHIDGVYR